MKEAIPRRRSGKNNGVETAMRIPVVAKKTSFPLSFLPLTL